MILATVLIICANLCVAVWTNRASKARDDALHAEIRLLTGSPATIESAIPAAVRPARRTPQFTL